MSHVTYMNKSCHTCGWVMTHQPSWRGKTLQHTATHWHTLQHTATHCNKLRHTATHCKTLRHTANNALHCNMLQHAVYQPSLRTSWRGAVDDKESQSNWE